MLTQPECDTIIVGGGLAGLACARHLVAQGLTCQLLESCDRVGGRVRTDWVDGFRLDRGFQVFLTSYPDAKQLLDYDALELRPFEPGALVRFHGRFHRFCDPWRRPQHVMSVALAAVGTLSDKWKVGRLRNRLISCPVNEILTGPNRSTIRALRAEGFSDQIIERFFRPFLGGVFLDRELSTSSRVFEFVFRMFATGDAALPATGMEAIPRQLANALPAGVVRTGAEVAQIEGQTVVLTNGDRTSARSIVVAVDEPAASRLLGRDPPAESRRATCLYFAAEKPPVKEPILVLNGDGEGPINTLAVLSEVSPSYARRGEALVCVTVLGDHETGDRELTGRVRRQLVDWFGTPATPWRHLRTYRIPHALPGQTADRTDPIEKPAKLRDGLFACGDYLDFASIQGALASGRRAAEAVVQSATRWAAPAPAFRRNVGVLE